MAAWVVGPTAAPFTPLRVFGMILPERERKFRGRDHSAQLVELCFLSIAERFVSGGESLCRRRALIQDLWSLWITLNIIDTITCPLGLPSPLEGLSLVVNPDARGGRHTSSSRTALFGVPPSRVVRRRPGRRRCRFPLSAACTRSALWRSKDTEINATVLGVCSGLVYHM